MKGWVGEHCRAESGPFLETQRLLSEGAEGGGEAGQDLGWHKVARS